MTTTERKRRDEEDIVWFNFHCCRQRKQRKRALDLGKISVSSCLCMTVKSIMKNPLHGLQQRKVRCSWRKYAQQSNRFPLFVSFPTIEKREEMMPTVAVGNLLTRNQHLLPLLGLSPSSTPPMGQLGHARKQETTNIKF